MGKFNSTDGVNFRRSIDDVVADYARFLLAKKIISDDEFVYFVNEGQLELLDVLFEKIYSTEEHAGIQVSTLEAFYCFCNFIIKEYHNQPIWNLFVKEMFLSVERNKNVCVMASRSLGKSFFNFVLYPLFKMFLYSGTKFLHVSNIPTQCVENLRITKDVIDTNEVLFQKKDVHKGKELKWTERQIEYNNGMLITLSAGTSPKGLHVNYVVVDDILTEGAQLNDVEIENYIFGQLYPTVQRMRGRLIVTGTPLHSKDIYHLLMGDKPGFEGNPIRDGRKSYKGFYSRMFPIMDDEENPFLPDIYDIEQIALIKQVQGDIKFEREYMLNCIDESLTIFSPHLIDSVSDSEEKYYYSADNSSQSFIIGVDVATSGAASADYSAFVVLELVSTETGQKKVIRHVVYEKGMEISTQVDTVQDLAEAFNNATVVIEKNNVGVALIQELVKRNVSVEEFITTKDKKEGMIRYLVNEMRNKNLWFPEETAEITRLKKELLNFGVKVNKVGRERMEALTGHDDMVIALAMANEQAQNIGGLPFAILQNR